MFLGKGTLRGVGGGKSLPPPAAGKRELLPSAIVLLSLQMIFGGPFSLDGECMKLRLPVVSGGGGWGLMLPSRFVQVVCILRSVSL